MHAGTCRRSLGTRASPRELVRATNPHRRAGTS